MRFPSADRYSEAAQNPTVYFVDPEVKRRRVQTDGLGLPEVLSGGFAFTYRFSGAGSDIAVRCFHRDIPELYERYQAISQFLGSLQSRFFVDFEFSGRGIHIDGTDLPMVRMAWIEGETLLEYVSRRRSDRRALERVREQLFTFANEAESRGYAHGDIQHRNILIAANGMLKLVDYDGMYVPALRHLRAADGGHPHFRLPSRSESDFGPRMDRFPLAVIDFSLDALQEMPSLFDQFHRGENLILSRDDFVDPAASRALNAIARVSRLGPKVAAFSDLCCLLGREMPSLREFRNGLTNVPVRDILQGTNVPRLGTYASPFDVVDGMDYSRCAAAVGRQVELIGQILQIKAVPKQGLILMRFGTRYTATPAVVIPRTVFARMAETSGMPVRSWVSVTGVLRTHHSGRRTSVQVAVKEASDIELLSKDEADFRLGRVKRVAPTSAPLPPSSQSKPTFPAPVWKATRGLPGGAPDWLVPTPASGKPNNPPQAPQRVGPQSQPSSIAAPDAGATGSNVQPPVITATQPLAAVAAKSPGARDAWIVWVAGASAIVALLVIGFIACVSTAPPSSRSSTTDVVRQVTIPPGASAPANDASSPLHQGSLSVSASPGYAHAKPQTTSVAGPRHAASATDASQPRATAAPTSLGILAKVAKDLPVALNAITIDRFPWRHATGEGVRWSLRILDPSRMLLLIDLGDDHIARLIVSPEFADLPLRDMNARIQWLKTNITEHFSMQSANYIFWRDGLIRPLP